MIRQNQNERKKQKKAENARMIKLIDNIFACDPRIRKCVDSLCGLSNEQIQAAGEG